MLAKVQRAFCLLLFVYMWKEISWNQPTLNMKYQAKEVNHIFFKPEVKAIQILDPGVDHRDSPKHHA